MRLKEFSAKTQDRIGRFFRHNPPTETAAYPCGHDDICSYISTHDEATPKTPTREKPDANCPGCGSNIDRNRYITRDVFLEGA